MGKRAFFLASVVCLAIFPAGLRAQESSDAAAVRALELKLLDCYKHHEVEVFASVLDDDFVITFEDGSTYSKTGYLSFSVTSSSHVDLVEMSDMKTRVHGHTAIVTGWYHEKGQNKGEKYDYHDRFTDVWMKKDGKWLLIASHYAVPMKQ